VDFELINLTK